MASILIRTVIIYILLAFSLRIMGKRQLGELDVGELVSTLLISEIAALPIDDPDIPLLSAVIPILFILSAEIIISTIKNKSEKLKNTIEGNPTYIIYKGRVLQNALLENRISVNELLSQMRVQGVSDIEDVYYCIVEQNGSLSIVKRDDTPLAHAIVIDGTVIYKNLQFAGFSNEWLENTLKNSNIKLDDIFLMTATDDGKTKIIKKDGSF